MIPQPSALRLLAGIHAHQAWRRLRSVGSQSRLLSSFIALFIIGYAVLAFFLFKAGLKFIGAFPGLGIVLTERLMFLLFAFLFVMLLFSNLVITYTNLFRNRETQFLLGLPVSFNTIFQWKFIESTSLASWAFLFLISPLLAAYGLSRHAGLDFYLFTLLLISLFIVMPAVAGAACAIGLARFLDRRRFQALAVLVAIGSIVGAVFWLKPEAITDEMLETRVLAVLDRLLEKTQFAQFPFLPSYWLSSGVLQWADGARSTAGFFFLVLLSNVLFWGFWSLTRSGNAFYDAFSAVHSRGSILGRWAWFQRWRSHRVAFQFESSGVESLLRTLLGRVLDEDVRALLTKDIRMFWRDTAQWGQTLVLFGLLGVYVINLRHFSQQLSNPFWVHLVSYLNLGACSLNLATLTTRFVYPQFSLEGKRVWIIGLAPIGLVRVVQWKFRLATVCSLAITAALMALSCQMLKMPWPKTLFFLGTVTIMTLTLNGLAVGLGTLYPNFKEDQPSKIVSGFGGTFCLVMSFLYIVASVVTLAVGSPWARTAATHPWLPAASWFLMLTLSILVGWLPYRLGLRRALTVELASS